MARFEWRQEYESGNDSIDTQHRQLLTLANLLFDAAREGREDVVLKQAFDALLIYTRQHFEDEEQLLAERKSTLLQEHQEEHHLLAEEVCDLWEENAMGFADQMGRSLERWVEQRLVPHMIEADQAALRATTA